MKKILKHSLLTILLGAFIALALVPRASATDLGNIWPLGDSVTYGAYHAGGYRDTLFTNLTARGYTFKFEETSQRRKPSWPWRARWRWIYGAGALGGSSPKLWGGRWSAADRLESNHPATQPLKPREREDLKRRAPAPALGLATARWRDWARSFLGCDRTSQQVPSLFRAAHG